MANRRRTDVLLAAGAAAAGARVLRRGFTARYVSKFATIALRRGMTSGSKGWLYAGAAASTFRFVHAFVGRKEEITRIKLRPGQTLQIRETPRPKGRR